MTWSIEGGGGWPSQEEPKSPEEEASLSNYDSHVGLGEEHGGGFVEALLIY
jgi:hypothetical protein